MLPDGKVRLRASITTEAWDALQVLANEEARQTGHRRDRAASRVVERAILHLLDVDPPADVAERRRRAIEARARAG